MKTLATMTLKARSGFAADDVVNTFALDLDDAFNPAVDLLDVSGPLFSFYNGVHAAGASLAFYLSDELSRAAAGMQFRLYDVDGDLGGTIHGSPVATDTGTMFQDAVGATSMPSETALVLTLRAADYLTYQVEAPDGADADAKVDRPRQRHSGRIFVGPWATAAGADDANGRSRPSGAVQTLLQDAAEQLQDDLGVNGHMWCIWSRKNASMYPVERVQVDDAWDTIRGRGPKALARQTRILL